MESAGKYQGKKIYQTIGLPRAGKTTWAKSTGFPIVNPDAIRLAVHGQAYIQEAEEFVWYLTFRMIAALFLAGHDTVVLDATNLKRERDAAIYERLPGVTLVPMTFAASASECIDRAQKDGREDLVPVIRRMAAEPPS